MTMTTKDHMNKRNRKQERGSQTEQDERSDTLTFDGQIEEALPGTLFKVRSDVGHVILCTLSGKLRINRIRLCVGDRVKCETSVYDPTRGRISWRC